MAEKNKEIKPIAPVLNVHDTSPAGPKFLPHQVKILKIGIRVGSKEEIDPNTPKSHHPVNKNSKSSVLRSKNKYNILIFRMPSGKSRVGLSSSCGH